MTINDNNLDELVHRYAMLSYQSIDERPENDMARCMLLDMQRTEICFNICHKLLELYGYTKSVK